MASYDEAEIKNRLSRLHRARKTAFAAACAERLWPLFLRCAEATGEGEVAVLRTVLDGAGRAARGEDVGDLSAARITAEDMVPADDGEWIVEMGYGQNAAAAVAYAVRTWLTDDPREAAWAARQAYEAADYAALCAHPELRLNVPGTERTLSESAMVQTAIAEMVADLVAVESPPTDDWEGLRARARDEGAVWAATLPSGDA